MSPSFAATVLEAFNLWRRSDAYTPQPLPHTPAEIGDSIDVAVTALRRAPGTPLEAAAHGSSTLTDLQRAEIAAGFGEELPPAPVSGDTKQLREIVGWMRDRGLYRDADFVAEGANLVAILSQHEAALTSAKRGNVAAWRTASPFSCAWNDGQPSAEDVAYWEGIGGRIRLAYELVPGIGTGTAVAARKVADLRVEGFTDYPVAAVLRRGETGPYCIVGEFGDVRWHGQQRDTDPVDDHRRLVEHSALVLLDAQDDHDGQLANEAWRALPEHLQKAIETAAEKQRADITPNAPAQGRLSEAKDSPGAHGYATPRGDL